MMCLVWVRCDVYVYGFVLFLVCGVIYFKILFKEFRRVRL